MPLCMVYNTAVMLNLIYTCAGSAALGRHVKFSERFANHAKNLAGLLCGGSRGKGDEWARGSPRIKRLGSDHPQPSP